METPTRFVVTAWRNSRELLQLRQDIYSSETVRRERAVNKVLAWRLRKPDGLPLLLDSTADIVDVILQDERGELKHNALRLLYATAISRFVTGLADTQIDLTRDRPSWFPPGKSLQLPIALLETRHRIVHRHLPSLAELKRAAKDGLEWLWEWYWSQLDHAYPSALENEEVEPNELVKEKLQNILKTYVKERKTEIKTRKKGNLAAENALSSHTLRFGTNNTTTPTTQSHRILLELLIDDKMILPADKKLGSSMSGAFLIWDPFFLAFYKSILPLRNLLTHLISAMNAPSTSALMINSELDPVREALHDWLAHVLCSDAWAPARASSAQRIYQGILADVFCQPTYWNIKLASTVLQSGVVEQRAGWQAVLDVAVLEGVQDVGGDGDADGDVEDIEQGVPASEEKKHATKEKIKGPTKVLGLWKPRPIGWVAEGWEDDE